MGLNCKAAWLLVGRAFSLCLTMPALHWQKKPFQRLVTTKSRFQKWFEFSEHSSRCTSGGSWSVPGHLVWGCQPVVITMARTSYWGIGCSQKVVTWRLLWSSVLNCVKYCGLTYSLGMKQLICGFSTSATALDIQDEGKVTLQTPLMWTWLLEWQVAIY